jgi:hypothetical protein
LLFGEKIMSPAVRVDVTATTSKMVALSFRFASQDIVHLVALLNRLFFALYFSLLEDLFIFHSPGNVNFGLEGLSDLVVSFL